MVDEIQIPKSEKVSAVNHEAPGFLERDYYENNLYQVENMIIDEAREIIEWRKRELELKRSYVIENWDKIIYIHDN